MSQQPQPSFRPATREQVKARVALAGPTGSGKTYTALAIAAALSEGGRVAVVDTEKGSASLFANIFEFDVLELGPPFAPARYIAAIHEAEGAGYAVVVVDSLSHAWSAEGGVLSIVDEEATRTKGNKFAAWQKGTPEHNRLVDALVQSPIHVVATMRSKMAYALEQDSHGRQQVRKIGMEPIQREGMEYEFTVVGELDLEHRLVVTKARGMPALQDKVVPKPGPAFGVELLAELRRGVSVQQSAPVHLPAADTVSAEVSEGAGVSAVGAGGGGRSEEAGPDESGEPESPPPLPPPPPSADTPTSTGAPTPGSPAAGPATSTEAAVAPVEDNGELATPAQWGLLDAHRGRVTANKIHLAARKLFPEADIRSNSQITKYQFEKAFAAVLDRDPPAGEEA